MHDLTRFICAKKTYGVYALDELPAKIARPCLIIANTSVASQPGDHWTSFYFEANSTKAEFFDSFGRRPTQPQFKAFLKKNSKSFIYNSKKIQGDFSSVCGQYSLLFLFFRCKNNSMADYLRQFNIHKREANDNKILRMYNKLSKLLQRISRRNMTQYGGKCNTITCNQTCTSLKKKKRCNIKRQPRV